MIPCMDFLAGAKYPKVVLESLPNGWGIGIFTEKNLFGDAYPLLDKLLSKGKTPLVRLQLAWRNHNFSVSDFSTIVNEAKRFVPLAKKYPNVEWQFSGACEHNLTENLANQLKDRVMAVIPAGCLYVNNPLIGKGSFINPGALILNEVHGENASKPNIPGQYNFSFDGDSCVDSATQNVKDACADARAFFYWDAPFNLKYESNENTPIPQRTWKPYPKLVTSIVYTQQQVEHFTLQKHFTWKSHAETKKPKPGQKLDPRADKPVLIAPIHGKVAKVIAKNGAIIATATRYKDDFVDGRARYYFQNMWGFEMAIKAKKISGTDVCELWIDNKKYGTFNPAFREN